MKDLIIKDKDIYVDQYRDETVYYFTWPKCGKELEMPEWEPRKKCKCGMKYRLKRTLEIIGKE